jgi:YVTN family beta-propeller protein
MTNACVPRDRSALPRGVAAHLTPVATLLILGLLLTGALATGSVAARAPPLPHQAPLAAAQATVSPSSAAARPAAGGSYVTGATILASIPVFSQPTVATFDPSDDDLYVQNFGAPILGGNTESIVADSTNTVLKTVAVGDDPLTSVYANATGDVYVMNFGSSNNVTVFHGTSIVAWIPTGVTPVAGLYDPSNQYIYVTNQGSNNFTVLNGTKTVGSIGLGTFPEAAALDTRSDWIYSPNSASNNVTVVNGSAGAGLQTVGSVTVGASPLSAIYDPDNGYVYVPNPGSNTVSVLNGTSVVTSLSVTLSPSDGCFDPANGEVYITDTGSNTVTVLNGTRVVANVSVGVFPRTPVFDAADDLVYVPSWTENAMDVVNGTTVVATVAVGTNPYGAMYDPHAEAVFSSNFNSNNLSRIGTPSSAVRVTFNETGLPAGTAWSVDWNSTEYPTDAAQIAFPSGAGTFNYSLTTVPGYSATPSHGQVTVGASPVTKNVTFAPAYPVSFAETGLVNGTFWSVTIGVVTNGTGNDSLQLWEPNGTYTYAIAPLPGYTTVWGGSVTVSGAGVPVAVPFTIPTYAVWFNETGLPAGTQWGATLGTYGNLSTNASVPFEVANGSYQYSLDAVTGYSGSPAVGQLSVTGSVVLVRVTFVSAYPVTFEESGLPAGTNWTVTLGTGPVSTTQSNVSIVRANGTYVFSVSDANFNYIPVARHGSFNVTGGAVVVPVAFETRRANASAFWLNFSESGLPSGVPWSVTLGAATNHSTGTTVGFLVGNASYSFSVSAVGFLPTPSHGLVVANGPASVATPVLVTFVAQPPVSAARYPIDFTADGLPSTVSWSVAIGNLSASGAGHPLTLDEPNGTYTDTLGPLSGYVGDSSRSVTVAGAPVAVYVLFHAYDALVEFREVGLPTGTSWNVTLGPTPNTTLGSVVGFEVANGTYPYVVGSVPGFATPAGGSVVVTGSGPLVVQLTFGAGTSSKSTVFGLSEDEAIGIAAGVAAVLVVAALLAPVRSRPPEEPGPEAMGGASGETPALPGEDEDDSPEFSALEPGDGENP